MKKLFLILVIISLLFLTMPVYAQSPWPCKTKIVETSTAELIDGPVRVLGISIYADAANSFMGIYNCDTLGETTNTNCKAEIGEATIYETTTIWFAEPVKFDDVSVVMSTGVGTIFYR